MQKKDRRTMEQFRCCHAHVHNNKSGQCISEHEYLHIEHNNISL